mmetsp:Transcript_10055/g.30716  ORF Transcript_10055/g.30716 Transcript_10055/m.30716 type:complete len:249 (-) Transcript_10055:2480-3226(-)
MTGFAADAGGLLAFAKIVAENTVYYVQKFSTSLGRGTSGGERADFLVSADNVVSRIHARIAYSPMEQGFEIDVLGKNGIIVNGSFVNRKDRPILLQSQSEINLVKQKPVVLTFLLPSSSCTKMDKKKGKQKIANDQFNIVNCIGESLALAENGTMTLDEIAETIWAAAAKKSFRNPFPSREILKKSVQHTLTINRYFCVTTKPEKGRPRSWRIRPEHLKRFAIVQTDRKRGLTVISSDGPGKRLKLNN